MSKYSAIKHLTKEDIVKNGSIFTPQEIVQLAFKKCQPHIDNEAVILDMGAGYGAFISKFRDKGKRCIGTECDATSIHFLRQEFPEIEFYHENSLSKVSRTKYRINENEKLIIIGNPPYNDITSQYKKGEKGEIECDKDIEARDLGISFLRAYNKLMAKYICVLHPLAYLIKKQNFKNLKEFKDNYKLIDATIFSSKEFESIKRTNAEFPVVAALYERNNEGMTFKDIEDFSFKIYHSRKRFYLKGINTIDGKVKKYPTKNSICKLQFYTLRDINALVRNATFVKGPINNGIDVTADNLYQYAWLDYFKNNFKPSDKYLYGNLSPLYSEEIETKEIQRLLISYIYKNELIKNGFSQDELENKYGKLSDASEYPELEKILEGLYL